MVDYLIVKALYVKLHNLTSNMNEGRWNDDEEPNLQVGRIWNKLTNISN